MRVLHVIDDLKLGGTQNLVLQVVRVLQSRGIDSDICVLNAPDRTYSWKWLPERITYLKITCDYRRPWELMQCAKRLRAIITKKSPDIVHSYLWFSDIVTALANRDKLWPHVSQIVDRREWQASASIKHRLRRWMTRRAFEKSGTTFLAVSEHAREFAVHTLTLDPSRVKVAYNSVAPELFSSVAPSKVSRKPSGQSCDNSAAVILGAIARLEPEKGHAYLLEAIADLRSRGVQTHLIVTGDGGIRSILEEQARQLDILQQVSFVGFVDNVLDVLNDIDVLVVPSIHSEGLPTTILEAMAAGRLVIATDVGGATEAIRDGVDGIIVPARNSSRLADSIEFLVKNHAVASEMVQSAQSRVRSQFTREQMVDRIVEEYQVRLASPKQIGAGPLVEAEKTQRS